MLTTVFVVSVGSIVLLGAPSDAISCYKDDCGTSSDINSYYQFNQPCVDPFSPTGKAKCNGNPCKTNWWFIWQMDGSVNKTTSAVSRECVNETDPYRLVIPTLDDCVGLSQKRTDYRDFRFFVNDNQCCYKTYYNYGDHGESRTFCFCLTDNCNDETYEPSANAVGSTYTEMSLVVVVTMAASLMSEKFI